MKAPLNVIEYFFPFVQVSADPEFVPEDDDSVVECETKVGVESNFVKNIHQVSLEITVMPENEDERIPYAIHLIAVGLFQVDENWDDVDKLLRVNGASILYSAAREFIITISSRGPWAAAILPTTSFLPPKETKEQQKKHTKKSKK
ncbi:MAG: protein-export chaperone SecB [Desulfocapsa sp.]|nr:protein-export chaperone SecB [Desulfocapsa sp.]